MRRLLLLACVVPAAAAAHDADVIFVEPDFRAAELLLSATLTAQSLSLLAPVDADGDGLLGQADLEASREAVALGFWAQVQVTAGGRPCARSKSRGKVRQSDVLLEASFACGAGEVRADFRFLTVLPPNYQVTLGRFGAAPRGAPAAKLPQTALTLRAERKAPAPAAPPPPAWTWAMFLAAPIVMMLFERRRF